MREQVLERLAVSEPRELLEEAKVELCRATRDLRSCGRVVHHVLSSCGHASLCVECRKRCDYCPICRTPVSSNNSCSSTSSAAAAPDRLRLYELCVEAGLVVQDNGDDAQQSPSSVSPDDVRRRLCSFFDVALDNNLVSLVCHYVTDVCMDAAAVSSNVVMSMLLDGSVVKEWCKSTTLKITSSLAHIYGLSVNHMNEKADVMERSRRKLEGIVQVMEVLEAPLLQHSYSSTLSELQQLLEFMRKVVQHAEVMAWCARHQFLDNVPPRFTSIGQWLTAVEERKSAAQERAWSDGLRTAAQLGSGQQGSLFIEDALANLRTASDDDGKAGSNKDFLELGWLQEAALVLTTPCLRYMQDAVSLQSGMLYLPDNVHAAVDKLFLEGSSDLILAKKAIFVYYLFDRHWTLSHMNWSWIVDDYMCTFSIPRHLILESLVFYLLDDCSEDALEEACRLLPEIATHAVHPKVVEVLLERGRPEAALAVLHASGQDGQASGAVPLAEALTTLRVWLHCDLLSEGYMYQRAHCDTVKHQGGDWLVEKEVLIREVCRYCADMGLLDRMLVLPWQIEEENFMRKCLLEYSAQDPSSTAGNLLVVFYVQRCRYLDAQTMHKMLCDLEKLWVGQCTDTAKVARVHTACNKRMQIIEKCMELLPAVQRQKGQSSTQTKLQESWPRTTKVDQTKNTVSLASPLFVPSGRSTDRKPIQPRDVHLPSTSASTNSEQPSILHGLQQLQSPIFPQSSLPVASEHTTTREYGSAIASPMQCHRLLYEPDLARDSTGSIVELDEAQSMDGLELPAGPSSWCDSQEKLSRGKSKRIGIAGTGLPLTAQNGSHKSRLSFEDGDGTDVVMADRHNRPSNGKRHPSDRPWLQSQSIDMEAHGSKGSSENYGFDSCWPNSGSLPSNASRRGLDMAEDGGGARWHSDDVEDDQLLTFIPSSHMKVFHSRGRLPSTIYSGHI
ncbi:hypothetical protein BDL97_03G026400 [Sphagnum fallax]|nr:hypothetical protein BDL97_03G026400 [Sphagnum fallax]